MHDRRSRAGLPRSLLRRLTFSGLWRPVLDDELATQARRAVDSIAADLIARSEEAMPGLSMGEAGIALFFHYLAADRAKRGEPDNGATAEALRRIHRALEALETAPSGPALFSGLAGICWASAHIAPGDELASEAIGVIDDALLGHVARPDWTQAWDVAEGIAGIAIAFLEQPREPRAREGLTHVVRHLEALAEDQLGAVTWRTTPALLPPHARERHPEGRYSLGVAHGVPGVIAVLAHARAAGVPIARADLIERAARWLGRERRDYPLLPYWIEVDGGPSLPARAAWCYGDPGVVATLLAAPLRDEEEAPCLLDEAAARAAKRFEGTGVEDASLCHGAAGLGLMFQRIHHATGADSAKEAARAWFAKVLEMRMESGGIGGYETVEGTQQRRVRVLDPGWLRGAAGTGLALLAATGDVEPRWDRALLLSGWPSGTAP